MAVLYYLPPQYKSTKVALESSPFTKTNSVDSGYYTKRAATKVTIYNGKTETVEERKYTVKNVWDKLLPSYVTTSTAVSDTGCHCGCNIAPISKVDQFIAAYDEAAPINDFTKMTESEIEAFIASLPVDINCECPPSTCDTHDTLLLRDITLLFKKLE